MQNITSLIESGIKLRQTHPSKALDIFNRALAAAKESEDRKYIAVSTFNIAIAYLNLVNYPESIKNFHKALNLDYSGENLSFKAEVLRGIATNFLRTYNYKEGLKYLYKSEVASIESKNFENLHMIYGSFGSLYSKLKLHEKALEYTLKSLELAETMNNPWMRQYSIMSVGACYYQLNEMDKAIKFLNEALEGSNQFAVANALHFLSIMKFDNKEFDISLEYAKKQVEISRKYNYYEYQALGIGKLGDIMFAGGKFQEALEYFNEAIGILNNIGEKLIFFSYCRKSIETYGKIGNTSKVNELYEKLYDDHVEHLEKEGRLKTEQINFEYEIERIKEEAEAEKQNNIRLQKALEEVKSLNSRLESVNQEKNDFMAVVIHDLKNPLQNISSAIRLLNNSEVNIDSDELTSGIVSQTDRMFNLINRLLDYRAIDEGKLIIKETIFEPEDICNEVINNLKDSAVQKNIKIVFRTSDSNTTLKTDFTIFYQIFENLLSNAIKFSPQNKNIFVTLHKNNGNVQVEIKDEGPGFTEKDKQKVFSSFARLSAQPTGNEQSTGLGLSIVKKLSEFIGAEISLISGENSGTTFIVSIPVISYIPL